MSNFPFSPPSDFKSAGKCIERRDLVTIPHGIWLFVGVGVSPFSKSFQTFPDFLI